MKTVDMQWTESILSGNMSSHAKPGVSDMLQSNQVDENNKGRGSRLKTEHVTFNHHRRPGSNETASGETSPGSAHIIFQKDPAPKLHQKHYLFVAWGHFMTLVALIFLAVVPSASANNQHHLTQGAPGSLTFDAPWNPEDGFFPYFTITFESESQPFCTLIERHPGGFKSSHQYDRFRVSYTLAEGNMKATVDISDVSSEDAALYIMTLTTIDAGSGSTIRVVKEVEVSPPRGEAQCRILDAPEGYSNHYADVSCRATAGRGNATLACYQDGVRLPYMREIHNDGEHVYGRFWMELIGNPVYCCSHDHNKQIYQNTCLDFVWPSQETATKNNRATASGQGLEPTPNDLTDSACDVHVHLLFVYAMVVFSLQVVLS